MGILKKAFKAVRGVFKKNRSAKKKKKAAKLTKDSAALDKKADELLSSIGLSDGQATNNTDSGDSVVGGLLKDFFGNNDQDQESKTLENMNISDQLGANKKKKQAGMFAGLPTWAKWLGGIVALYAIGKFLRIIK